MSDAVAPATWLRHLEEVDGLRQFLEPGGSLVRVVTSHDRVTHTSLVDELSRLSGRLGLVQVGVDRLTCPRLHLADDVVAVAGGSLDFPELFARIARRVWNRIGAVGGNYLLEDVRAILCKTYPDLRSDFRSEMDRYLADFPGFSRDFRSAIRVILIGVISGGHAASDALERVESYFTGTGTLKELREIEIQRRLTRETATRILRNMVELCRAAGHIGTLLHLDFRWLSNPELVPSEFSFRRASRTQRVAAYQWIRELIDGVDHFSSLLICTEFGPKFPDPDFRGSGWGLYDALRLRLEDGVRPIGGPNLSAPFIPLRTC